jgi:hypothetical protein
VTMNMMLMIRLFLMFLNLEMFFWSNFIVSHDWALSHRHMPRGFNLEVSQTFSSKNKLVNVVKLWHIAHSIEYQVQQ